MRKFVSGVVAAVMAVTLIQAVEFVVPSQPALAAPTPPSTIALTASRTEIIAGQKARLTATTDTSVSNTGQTISIVDLSTDETLHTCTTGRTCRIDVQFVTGDPREYAARVGELESAPVTVSRAAWSVTLTADKNELVAGESARLVATANQNVTHTDGAFAIYLFNATTGELLAECTTGKTCAARSGEFYRDRALRYDFTAVVAAPGSTTLESIAMLQAQATTSLNRQHWSVTTTADKTNVVAGDVVKLTATTDQRLHLTNGRYAQYIVNAFSGEVLTTCTSGTTCATNFRWTGVDRGLALVAFVATAGASNLSELSDVQAAVPFGVNITQWEATISVDRFTAIAGEKINVVATANQNVGSTAGGLALYIVDWASGIIIKRCRMGSTCEAADRFYKSGNLPYVAAAYAAVVATDDASISDPTELEIYTSSFSERVEMARWEITIDLVGGGVSRPMFMVEMNQDLSLTGRQLAVYVWAAVDDENQLVAQCFSGARCVLSTTVTEPTVYLAYVAERTAEPSYEHANWTTRALATYSTYPVVGPLLDDEAIGGGNPAEKACQCSQADPVNTATGEFYDSVTDMTIPGVGPALQLARSYSTAKSDEAGPFGYGWSADLGMRIEVKTPDTTSNPRPLQVEVVQENGSKTLFTRHGTNTYRALDRVHATLSHDDTTGDWTFVRDLTQTFIFDAAGSLSSLSDVNGNALTFSYADGRLHTISAPGGRSITLVWADDRITSATDSAGRTVSYVYDALGDLVQVAAVDGAVTTYSYDAAHRIVSFTNPLGGTVTNAFDADGRVTSQTDAVGGVTTFAYSSSFDSDTTDVTHPDGSVVRDEYQYGVLVAQTSAYGTPLAARSSFQYDHAVNRIAQVDPAGEATTFTYDKNGRRLTQTDPLGRVTTWTYDKRGNVKTVTDPMGAVTRNSYDENGNLTTTRSAANAVERFTHNDDGTVATHKDARGKITTFAYTPQGWLMSTTDPVGLVTSVGYDPAGFATSVTDPGGSTTISVVDAAGRTLSTTDALGRTTTFAYDAGGNQVATTDANGATTTASYDVASRRISTTDALGNTTAYSYTPTGALAMISAPGSASTTNTYNALGQLVATTDPLGRVTSFGYDVTGRQASTTRPSGATMTIAYDVAGQPTSTTDASGETTTLQHDDAGRVVLAVDPLERETATAYTADGQVDTVTLPDGSTQNYSYDKNGNVTSFTDADGNTTEYKYDAAGRLNRETRPGGLITRYTYDDAGRLFVTRLPDNSTLRHYYDAAGQLIRIDPSRTGAADILYTYDAAGRRATMSDETGTTSYVYDVLGRLTEVTDGSGAVIGYSYDARGNLTELEYPGGDIVTYTYDLGDQLSSVSDWDAAVTGYSWTLDGLLASRSDPNGLSYSVAYDVAGRTTGITAASTSTSLLDIAYDYDAAGQLTSRAVTGSAAIASTDTYGYDLLGQLAAKGSGGSFQSTPAGALTATADGTVLAYNTAQQVTTLTPPVGPATTFGYGANGERITSVTGANATTYSYDAFGALTEVVLPTGTVSYIADGTGLRQTRTDTAGTRHFTWDVNAALPRLLEDGTHRYLYGVGIVPIAQHDGTDTEYLYGDLLGTTMLIADATGAMTCAYAHSEYGAVTTHTGTSTTEIGYTGNWTDPTTGLVYLRARDHDPTTGQFLRVDPAVAETLQPYAYAANSPLLLADPSGLCVGMDGTPQDRQCTFNDYFWEPDSQAHMWGKIGSDIGNNFANMAFGIADAVTFNPGLAIFGASSWTELWRNAWIDDCVVPANGFYTFGGLWAGAALGGIGSASQAAARSYVNLTVGGSVRNVGTNATHREFTKNLLREGWSKRPTTSGRVQVFEKDGAKYVLRDKASSYPGWSADFTAAGAKDVGLKIRLGYRG